MTVLIHPTEGDGVAEKYDISNIENAKDRTRTVTNDGRMKKEHFLSFASR